MPPSGGVRAGPLNRSYGCGNACSSNTTVSNFLQDSPRFAQKTGICPAFLLAALSPGLDRKCLITPAEDSGGSAEGLGVRAAPYRARERGSIVKKFASAAVIALGLSTSAAFAADLTMPGNAPPPAAPPPTSPCDAPP